MWEGVQIHDEKMSNHDFNYISQIQVFRNGLKQQQKLLLYAISGGSLMSKNVEDSIVIIERMEISDHQG